jgi:branched-chain amino acid transport system substrate-binding protein
LKNPILKRLTNIVLFISLVIGSAALLQCSKKPEVIKLGFIGPLTGPAASYGVAQRNGIMLAADEINSAGGVNGKKIEVIFEDSQMDPNKAINAIKKLIDIDKVVAVIGETTTGGTLAIAETANRTKTVLLSPSASGAKITEAGDFVFRISPSDSFQAIVASKLVSEMGLKKGAIVFTNDDWGGGLQKAFQADFTKLGGSILTIEGCTPGTKDFRTQLVKIKSLQPDFIYIPLHPDESAIFLRQVKELKVPGRIIGADNFSEKAILKAAGAAAEGVIFTMPAEPSGEAYKNFSIKYKAKFNEEASYSSAAGYDSLNILVEAIKKSGLSGEKIKNALYEIKDYKGVSGVIGFDQNGDVITKTFEIIQIKDGEYIPYKRS